MPGIEPGVSFVQGKALPLFYGSNPSYASIYPPGETILGLSLSRAICTAATCTTLFADGRGVHRIHAPQFQVLLSYFSYYHHHFLAPPRGAQSLLPDWGSGVAARSETQETGPGSPARKGISQPIELSAPPPFLPTEPHPVRLGVRLSPSEICQAAAQ